MQKYLDLLQEVLSNGDRRKGRGGNETFSLFGQSFSIDLADGFPLLTTKKVHFKSIAHELLWFISGSQNTAYLDRNGVSIWNEWQDPDGNVGKSYGYQWRSYGGCVDQLEQVIHSIMNKPYSRRHLVSAWNPAEVGDVILPPCHYSFQFHVNTNGRLNCVFNMRSTDVFLGLPFNVASYALLTSMVAKIAGLQPGMLMFSGCDVHLYSNHVEQAIKQLERVPVALPSLVIQGGQRRIDDFKYEDFIIEGYSPQPAITAKVSI